MGHLVNPISFRLGYSRNWGFSGALMESKLQYQYLNFKYYNLLKFFERLFKKDIFRKFGIIYSHTKMLSNMKEDNIVIYIYDGPLQAQLFIVYKFLNKKRSFWRKLRKITIKYISRCFYKLFFSLNVFKLKIKLKQKSIQFLLKYLKSKIVMFYIKILFYFLFYKLILTSSFNFVFFDKFIFFLLFSYFNKIFFFNSFFKNLNNIFFLLEFSLFELLNFVRYFFIFNFNQKFNFCIKTNTSFFFYSSYYYYFLFFNKFQYNLLKNKLKLIFKTLNLKTILNSFFLFDFNKSSFFKITNKLMKIHFRSRRRRFMILNYFLRAFFFNNFYSYFIKENIIKYFKINKFLLHTREIFLYFKSISKMQINASLISRYICIRLRQKFRLSVVLNPIFKDLGSNRSIEGFKISCCGRFSKKEIATYKWEKRGRLSLNSITTFIDYSYKSVVLKYSICGIKIWLQRKIKYPYKKRERWFFVKYFSKFDKQNLNKKRGKELLYNKKNLFLVQEKKLSNKINK